MIELILKGQYKVNGYYVLDGVRGKQEGDILHCPDNKIIGGMKDNNKADYSKTTSSIIIGYLKREKFCFLKIHRGIGLIRPIIWKMELRKKTKGKLYFSGNYYEAPNEYCFVTPKDYPLIFPTIIKKNNLKHKFKFVNELVDITIEGLNKKNLLFLYGIPVTDLKKAYFARNSLASLEKITEQTGEITLERV